MTRTVVAVMSNRRATPAHTPANTRPVLGLLSIVPVLQIANGDTVGPDIAIHFDYPTGCYGYLNFSSQS